MQLPVTGPSSFTWDQTVTWRAMGCSVGRPPPRRMRAARGSCIAGPQHPGVPLPSPIGSNKAEFIFLVYFCILVRLLILIQRISPSFLTHCISANSPSQNVWPRIEAGTYFVSGKLTNHLSASHPSLSSILSISTIRHQYTNLRWDNI